MRSPVGACVAELEALVDQRKVGEHVVGGRVRDRRPVRVRAGPEPKACDAATVSLDDAERRAAGALHPREPDRRLVGAPRAAAAGASARSRRPSRMSNDCASSSGRWSNRLCTSPTARAVTAGSKPAYASSGDTALASSGRPAARAPGPTVPSRVAVAASTMPMSGSLSWNDRLKSSSRVPRSASSRSAWSAVAGPPDRRIVEVEIAPPDRHRAEQVAVPCQLPVQPTRSFGEGAEELRSRGEPRAGADRGDVVEVAPRALELEKDSACASELGGDAQAEQLLAGLCVRDGVRHCAGAARAGGVRQPARRSPSLRLLAPAPGACRRAARRGGGSSHRRRGSESAPIR